MDGAFNGYLPYAQPQQPPSQNQSQAQQSQQSGPQSAHPSPSASGNHLQPHQQHSGLSSYGPIPGQHASDSPTHPTLPPLQSQNPYPQFAQLPYGHAGNQSHTPPGSHTPVSSSLGNGNGYSHQPPSMMPPTSYNQPYGLSPALMYPTSTAASIAQTAATAGLPNIRPMPPGGVGSSMNGLPSLASAGHLGQQPSFMQTEDSPTHVVGSQGRRGILPSAPGRPNPPPQGSGLNAKSMIPQKDADGKFPCPHCNKTYLHAKHLKRHLLRHTGDRPYMCHLCKDTFSRSDILKRHFQKCSIRRGNPTGANHLAHQRRPTNASNRLSMNQQDSPIGLAGMAEAAGSAYNPAANVVNNSPSASEMSTRSSRANSLIGANGMNHRNGITGLGIIPTGGTNGEQMGSTAGYQPGMSSYAISTPPNGSMTSNYAFSNQSLNGSGYNTPTQPMSFLGQTSSRFNPRHPSSNSHLTTSNGEEPGSQLDWSPMFTTGGQDDFVESQPANASSGPNDVKSEISTSKFFPTHIHSMTDDIAHQSFLGDLYSHPDAFTSEYSKKEGYVPGFPNWVASDPIAATTHALRQFCLEPGINFDQSDPASGIISACLTVDNIKHFAECFLAFQRHWPILHTPTFKFTSAHLSLALVVTCVGAVYSSRLHPQHARQLIDFVRLRVLSTTSFYNQFLQDGFVQQDYGNKNLEELQAVVILQVLSVWHGDSHQRHAAREEMSTLSQMIRSLDLLHTVAPGQQMHSVLHASPRNSSPAMNSTTFKWRVWLEQEKRNRLLHTVLLMDAASALFFNTAPNFDPLEVYISLPCDDDAWNAKDGIECASALGLAATSARERHMARPLRPQQLIVHDALRALLDPLNTLPAGVTNAYSKLILMHALIVRTIACQQKTIHHGSPPFTFHTSLIGSGPATPLSQNDWLDQHRASGSGHVTPTDSLEGGLPMQPQHDKTRLGNAMNKLKQVWDADTDLNEPMTKMSNPSLAINQTTATVFQLGRSLLQSHDILEWTASSDLRFRQVTVLLDNVRAFSSDQKRLGQYVNNDRATSSDRESTGLILDITKLFPASVI